MAYDIFVNFEDKKPTKDEIEKVTKQFFGEVCTNLEWKEDRFIVSLIGKGSMPLNGIGPLFRDFYCSEERWLEIWIGDSNIDIITREADEFTNVVASGLAAIFARVWKGKVDE